MIGTKTFKPTPADNNKNRKCLKNILTVMFCNNRMRQINLNRILKFKTSIARLPGEMQLRENIPLATFKLTPTIKKIKL